ncbi:hypothetical protein ABL78_4884 [Leptomonas seymouri]|uniref:CCHC-type domain-containing protein n=1 Tax=Leptomonas seymouri TaxID=5684 RepID=A0A0N0P548_LEPSE|nr:hypothetical protein ABL78_4884 [Leptomonas seymouri]|eukprot:KPI86046.1 hypothetical protein ABL78_4884 [Leptomonas seymouri]
MPPRITLPLRLVQCDWHTAGPPTASAATRTRVLTPYKPCGLRCYAASQVSAAAGAAWTDCSSSSGGADGRRLFAIHTRRAAAAGATSLEASAQPQPEDPSDSLLTRVIDASLPGCRPYVALPVISSLLRRGGGSSSGSHPIPAALFNQWTSQHKGLVLVTQTPSDALFLRNAAQLDLVQQIYRVVCRLPASVASALRRYQDANQRRSNGFGQRGTVGAGDRQGGGAAVLLNPYLGAHAERQREVRTGADLTYGIPLAQVAASAHGGAAADFAGVAQLPADVHPHPLVQGGFFDAARGLLRVQGTVRCVLRVQTPLCPFSQQTVERFERLQRLFTAPPLPRRSAAQLPCSIANNESNAAIPSPHPWLKPEWRIGVSLDVPDMRSASSSYAGDGDRHRRGALPAPPSKSLVFDFRLVSVATEEGGGTALYELHTRGDVTADEIAAVFHAEGLPVLNDYAHDVPLADALEEVAQRMRGASPGLLASLPIGAQHHLRSASAEELVALPLMVVPLEDADRLCIHSLSSSDDIQPSSSSMSQGQPLGQSADNRERMQHYAQFLSGGAGARHPLQRLLWHAMGTLNLSNAEEKRVYTRVLSLALGSGVECASLTFPDSSIAATVHAMQHVWQAYEQQRQRRASLAEAARAARQHPLAAELRYVRRSVLSDAVGLSRMPLLEDVVQTGGPGGEGRCAARGECSFSHAVALAVSLDAVKESSRGSAQATASAATHDLLRSTAAWWQTEVPPSYAGAYSSWASASWATLSGDAATEVAEAAAKPSLWPSPAGLQQRTQQRPLSAHQRSETAAGDDHESPTVRLLLRVEELSELSCGLCSAPGHTWQSCATRSAAAVAALEGTEPNNSNSSSDTSNEASLTARADASDATTAAPRQFLTSVMEAEGLTTVEDAAAVLADQATALTNRREQRSRVFPEPADGGTSVSTVVVVPVSNMAVTQQFKAAHVRRSESLKPAMHRRTVRCVYCGGYHHVTACPKLKAQDGELASEKASSASFSATAAVLPLFCIKCGGKGHVFMDCPQVPDALNPARYCPICCQQRKDGSHDPMHCPQRVPVPTGYSLSGHPRGGSSSSSATDEGIESRARPPRGGRSAGEVGWSGSRRRSPSSSFASPRRRRGSVLIADSFVDSPSRRE